MTCDCCKWWSNGPEFESHHKKCLNANLQSNAYHDNSLAPQDLHELDAITTTGPKFGCLHFEQKQG